MRVIGTLADTQAAAAPTHLVATCEVVPPAPKRHSFIAPSAVWHSSRL